MIHDDDLRALAEVPVSAGGADRCRPVADVLVRGHRLRRRRQAVRAAGVTAVVGTVAATSALVLTRDRDPARGDVQTQETSPTTTPEPDALFADPYACWSAGSGGGEEDQEGQEDRGTRLGRVSIGPTPIRPEEVRDEARLLPTWTPAGVPITRAGGSRYEAGEAGDCPAPVATLQSTLSLRATAADGTITALIVLEGPYSMLAAPEWGVGATPTQVRGQDGRVVDPSSGDDTALEWTEPDGSGWRLRGESAGEAELRAVAEALQLDASPEPGAAPARLAPEDLPAGYEVAEQATTVPTQAAPARDDALWQVQVGEVGNTQNGIFCRLDVWDVGDDEPSVLPSGVGSRAVPVGGTTGFWNPLVDDPGDPGRWASLSWDIGPGVEATAECVDWDDRGGRSLPLEDVIRFAESVEPVAPDDPRIPPPPAN